MVPIVAFVALKRAVDEGHYLHLWQVFHLGHDVTFDDCPHWCFSATILFIRQRDVEPTAVLLYELLFISFFFVLLLSFLLLASHCPKNFADLPCGFYPSGWSLQWVSLRTAGFCEVSSFPLCVGCGPITCLPACCDYSRLVGGADVCRCGHNFTGS